MHARQVPARATDQMFTKQSPGAGEVAQSVKHLQLKPEDLQHPHERTGKKPGRWLDNDMVVTHED